MWHVYTDTCTPVHMYATIRIHTDTSICVYEYTVMDTYEYTHIHACMRKHVLMHMHACPCGPSSARPTTVHKMKGAPANRTTQRRARHGAPRRLNLPTGGIATLNKPSLENRAGGREPRQTSERPRGFFRSVRFCTRVQAPTCPRGPSLTRPAVTLKMKGAKSK